MAFTPLQKGAATTVALSAIALVVAVANPFGGPFGPNGGAGGASFGGSSVTFTSTQTDGGPGFCFNGSCAVSLASDGGVVTLSGAELYVPNGFTDSQKVNANNIITPYAVVSQAASGQRAFGPAHDGARVYFGGSGNVYCYNNAGQIRCAAGIGVPSEETDTIGNYTPGRNRVEIFYPQPYPLGSLTTCDTDHRGILQTLTTDGRSYACDGTTNQRLAYSLSNTTSINWGSLGPNDSETQTQTVTGALTSDAVFCSPVNGGSMQGMDMHPTVTSSNTVSIVAHNDTGGTIDPAAMDIKCVIVR